MIDAARPRGRGAARSSALVGPSGCGKSTLLELIAGLLEPAARHDRASAASRGRRARLARCAYMPQRDLLLPWLRGDRQRRARAAQPRRLARRGARRGARRCSSASASPGSSDARPAELSGGMRQRVAFLRTLLAGKPVLLLDEPFASLDAITRAEMQEWLAGALARRAAAPSLLVTHDVEEALYLCDRVVVLSARPARAVAELARAGAARAAAQPRRSPTRRSSPCASARCAALQRGLAR